MEYLVWVFVKLLPHMPVTLLLVAASFILGLFFAVLVTVMKLCKYPVVNAIATAYISVIRCTPPVIIFFLCFFGLPVLLAAIGIDSRQTNSNAVSIFAMTLMATGIMSEMLRGAYLSVDKGQFEAAVSTGLTPFQAMREIVAPQTLYIALPNFGNMLVALLQESSMAYMIGTVDIIGRATIISSTSYGLNAAPIFAVVTLIYWVIAVIIGRVVEFLINRMGRSRNLLTAKT